MFLNIGISVTQMEDDPSTGLLVVRVPVPNNPSVVIVEGFAYPEEKSVEAHTTVLKGAIDHVFSELGGWGMGNTFRNLLATQLASSILK